MEYKKGDWVKWTRFHVGHRDSQAFVYCKVDHVKKGNFIYYTDKINASGKHEYKKDYCSDDEMVVVDVSEVMPYLPIGHSDLLPQEVNFSIF